MGTISKISRKILYLVKARPTLEAVRTAIPQGVHPSPLYSPCLLFPRLVLDFRSLQLKIPSQVVQLIEKLATACLRPPEGSFGVQARLSRISCQLSFPSVGKRCAPLNSLGRRPLSASIPREPTDCGRSRTGSESTYAGPVATATSLRSTLEEEARSARRNDRNRARCRGDHRSGVCPDRQRPFVLPSPPLGSIRV